MWEEKIHSKYKIDWWILMKLNLKSSLVSFYIPHLLDFSSLFQLHISLKLDFLHILQQINIPQQI